MKQDQNVARPNGARSKSSKMKMKEEKNEWRSK